MIETLTDNHAILLLYLAGELPESDRREVDRRLKTDPNLAALLAELSAIYQQIDAGIASLDEIDRDGVSSERAISAAVKSIEGWRFGPQLVQPPKVVSRHRIWAWVAPASLAASILVAALLWIDRRPAGVPNDNGLATSRPTTMRSDDSIADKSDVDSDSNLALLQQSFATGFEQTPRRISSESHSDATARNDLSDYLLKSEVGQQ